MEKILFMGVEPSTELALDYAKETGVYTIISDFRSEDSNSVKKNADEIWKIDLKDVKTLEAACRESNVTGVYACNNEFCIDRAKELSENLFGDFYVPEEIWNCARDKTRFKSQCIRAGLEVPHIYEISYPLIPDQYNKLRFPVVVKPSDSTASQGLTICRNALEFETAYEYALKYSSNGIIVVEDFIEGDEYVLEFCFYEGKAYQIGFSKIFKQYSDAKNINGLNIPAVTLHSTDTEYYKEYKETVFDKVMKMLQNMHCQNGVGFIQAIYQNHKFYFLEFACRLDGVGSWATEKMLKPFNRIEYIVDILMHRDLQKWKKDILSMTDYRNFNGAEYLLPLKPGKVAKIEGLDKVRNMDRVMITLERFHEGDICGDSKSMYQYAYYMAIGARSLTETKDILKTINETLHIYDENGREMLNKFQNFELFIS